MGCCEGQNAAGKVVDQKALYDQIMANLPPAVISYYETAGHQLQALGQMLPMPDNVRRDFYRPIFHPDGSIEYPSGRILPDGREEYTLSNINPKDINGYLRADNNPWLFMPLWGECTKRMQGLQFDPKSGEVDVKMVCNNPESPHNMKFVTAMQCHECPVRCLPKRKNPDQPQS